MSNPLTEFWFATIAAAALFAFSFVTLISTISTYVTDRLSFYGENGEMYGGGFQDSYLISQVVGSLVCILVAIILLATRRSR